MIFADLLFVGYSVTCGHQSCIATPGESHVE
jgi:hypothetical protein